MVSVNYTVMGHVLANGLDLMGTGRSPRIDPYFQGNLSKMMEVSQRSGVSDWEKQHAKAIDLLGKGLVLLHSY